MTFSRSRCGSGARSSRRSSTLPSASVSRVLWPRSRTERSVEAARRLPPPQVALQVVPRTLVSLRRWSAQQPRLVVYVVVGELLRHSGNRSERDIAPRAWRFPSSNSARAKPARRTVGLCQGVVGKLFTAIRVSGDLAARVVSDRGSCRSRRSCRWPAEEVNDLVTGPRRTAGRACRALTSGIVINSRAHPLGCGGSPSWHRKRRSPQRCSIGCLLDLVGVSARNCSELVVVTEIVGVPPAACRTRQTCPCRRHTAPTAHWPRSESRSCTCRTPTPDVAIARRRRTSRPTSRTGSCPASSGTELARRAARHRYNDSIDS